MAQASSFNMARKKKHTSILCKEKYKTFFFCIGVIECDALCSSPTSHISTQSMQGNQHSKTYCDVFFQKGDSSTTQVELFEG